MNNNNKRKEREDAPNYEQAAKRTKKDDASSSFSSSSLQPQPRHYGYQDDSQYDSQDDIEVVEIKNPREKICQRDSGPSNNSSNNPSGDSSGDLIDRPKDIEECFLNLAKNIYALLEDDDCDKIVAQLNSATANSQSPELTTFAQMCAFNGWFRMMRWGRELRGSNWSWGYRTMEYAVERASLETIEWMVSEGCSISAAAVENCLVLGKLEALQYFYFRKGPCLYSDLHGVHENCVSWFSQVAENWSNRDFGDDEDELLADCYGS